MDKENEEQVRKVVREGYKKIALDRSSCCPPVNTGCCGDPIEDKARALSKKIGYTDEELDSVPGGADMGLGCGNPVALASLKKGETVIDLGSGPGMDCFLAADRVGRTGRVIGVDMTHEMLEKARENAKNGNYENVEFRLGEIENLPVADNTADIIISNCVINLSPRKDRVFQEGFRTLRPGGRLMVSDIVLLRELPRPILESAQAYIGCLSGAMMKDDYLKTIRDAGFQDVEVLHEAFFSIDLMLNDPTVQAIMKDKGVTPKIVEDVAHTVLSIKVKGIKPA